MALQMQIDALVFFFSKPIEPNLLFDCLLKHLMLSKGDSEAVGEQPSKSFETAMHTTLIPSGILPLLHDIACQLVQDGNQKSCYRIYR